MPEGFKCSNGESQQLSSIAVSDFRISEDEAVYHVRTDKKIPKSPSYKLIDLFSGAGGLTLGFTDRMGHCFKPVWANDFNAYAATTYNENFDSHCVVGDIVDIIDNPNTIIPKADVVIGGPPWRCRLLRAADPVALFYNIS